MTFRHGTSSSASPAVGSGSAAVLAACTACHPVRAHLTRRIHSRIHSQSFSCASDHFKHDNEANAAPHLFHFGLNCRHLSEELLWMLCFQQPQSLKMTELTLEISDIATACCILMCTSLCRLSLNLVNLLADGGSARVEGLLLVCRSHFIGCQSAAVRSTCCAMRVRCDMCDLCQRRPSDDMKVRSGRTRQSTAKNYRCPTLWRSCQAATGRNRNIWRTLSS